MSGGLDLRVGEAEGSRGPGVPPDDDLWARAFSCHRDELLGFARRALHDPDQAEEVVQETFLRAIRARTSFDPGRGPVRAWLFAIERRVLADVLRARRSRPGAEPAAAARLAAPSEDPTERWQVEAALLELSSEHRQVILEIYYRGRTARDLARRLALPEGTVRSRLYYGLRQLRHNLERSGWQS